MTSPILSVFEAAMVVLLIFGFLFEGRIADMEKRCFAALRRRFAKRRAVRAGYRVIAGTNNSRCA